jgi:hypothetical protein
MKYAARPATAGEVNRAPSASVLFGVGADDLPNDVPVTALTVPPYELKVYSVVPYLASTITLTPGAQTSIPTLGSEGGGISCTDSRL